MFHLLHLMKFYETFLEKVVICPDLLKRILFTDESSIELNVHLNKQKDKLWLHREMDHNLRL